MILMTIIHTNININMKAQSCYLFGILISYIDILNKNYTVQLIFYFFALYSFTKYKSHIEQ